MKKDLVTHFSFTISLLVLLSIVNGWLVPTAEYFKYLPYWFGGIIGTLLPDIDHLIYAYVLRPKEAVSQKVAGLIAQRQVVKTWDIFANTRNERKDLIFHSATFQLIFVAFAILVITSSESILGKGLVLAFMLHLLIDQVMDLVETKSLDNWFKGFPVTLDSEQKRYYLIGNLLIILVLGIML